MSEPSAQSPIRANALRAAILCAAFVWLAACIAVQWLLVSNASVAVIAPWIAGLSALVVGALAGLRQPRLALIALIPLALNLAALGVHAWAVDETYRVRISANVPAGEFTAQVVAPLSESVARATYPPDIAGRPRGGLVGFRATGIYDSPPPTINYEANALSRLARQVDGLWPPMTIDNIVVRDGVTDDVLMTEDFERPETVAGWRIDKGAWHISSDGKLTAEGDGHAFFGNEDWQNVVIEFDLARPAQIFGIVAGYKPPPSGGGGYLLATPQHSGWQWSAWDGVTWVLAGPSAFLPKGGTNQLKVWVSVIAKSWQSAVLLALCMSFLSLLLCAVAWPLSRLRVGGAESGDEGRRGRACAGDATAALIIVAIGAATAYVCARVGLEMLDGAPHVQDSQSYLFQAKVFALGLKYAPLPAVPAFFESQFNVASGGKWFAAYPPGWPLALALGVLAGAPWLINPILAGICGILIGVIAWRISGSRVTGIFGAALALSSPFILQMGSEYMAHMVTLASFCAFFLCVMLMYQAPSRSAWSRFVLPIATGFFAAWGVLSRPISGLALAAPVVIFVAFTFWRQDKWWRWLIVAAAGLATMSIVLVINDGWNAYTGNNSQSFGASTILGYGQFVIYQNIVSLLRHLFGWPYFATLAFALIPFVLGRFNRWNLLLFSGVAIQVLSYGSYNAGGLMYGPRYFFEISGALCILTAQGIFAAARLAAMGAQRLFTVTPFARALAHAPGWALTAGLMAMNFTSYLPAQILPLHAYNTVDGRNGLAVERLNLKNALVIVNGSQSGQWGDYGEYFWLNDPLLSRDVIYARDLGPEKNGQLKSAFPNRDIYEIRDRRNPAKRAVAPLGLEPLPLPTPPPERPPPGPLPGANPNRLAGKEVSLEKRYIGSTQSRVTVWDLGPVKVASGGLTILVGCVAGYDAVFDYVSLVDAAGKDLRFEAEDFRFTTGDEFADIDAGDGHWWNQDFGPFSGRHGLVARKGEVCPVLTTTVAAPDGDYALKIGTFAGDEPNGPFGLSASIR